MRDRTAVRLGAALVLIAASGCGPGGRGGSNAGPTPAAGAQSPPRAASPTEGGKADQTADPAGDSSPRGSESASSPGSPGRDMRLEIEIAECFEKGSVARATIRAEPAAMLGMAVQYDDYQDHADYMVAVAGADGSFVWTWTIPPEVPAGPATIVAAGGSADGKRAGSAREEFTVAKPGGCR